MNKKNIISISLWLVLGLISGFIFLNLTYQKDLPDVLENTSPSVVNIWSMKKWKAWQEKSSLLGIKRYQQVIKTGFFPNGSGVVIKENLIVTNFHVIRDAFNQNQELLLENHRGETEVAQILGFELLR